MLTESGASAKKSLEKNNVALSSVVAAVFLTCIKLVVGLLTGSLGILSEAAHSGLDLIAAVVTLFAVRLSDRPPDEVHQFGHGKVENLSALVETLLLLLTCFWIIYEAINRLFFKSVEVDASIWAFIIMTISIVVDITRSRALMRAAKVHGSQALEADALHFSTDVWSSSVVIGGLACVLLGERLGLPWLAKADAVAALAVAFIVIYVSYQLGRRAITVLLDAAPSGLRGEIESRVVAVSGVEEIRALRLRQSGAQTFVDVAIAVPAGMSLQQGHQVAGEVEAAIDGASPGADVIVHVDMTEPLEEDLPGRVRSIAASHGMRVHALHAHEVGGRLSLNSHAEVDSTLTLEQAHQLVTQYEADLRRQLGPDSEIVTHIEPVGSSLPALPARRTRTDDYLRQAVLVTAAERCGPQAAHDVHILIGSDGRRDVTMHCRLQGATSITDAHQLSEETERAIRQQFPDLGTIIIHVEPA